jgi:hypothetical protein
VRVEARDGYDQGRSPMRKFVLLVALGLVAAALSVPAAKADHQHGHCGSYSYHPSDPSYACQWWSRYIRACDRQVDGHQVRAWWEGSFAPGQYWQTAWAPSGGCVQQGTQYGSGNILRYRICVEAEGCSAWRRP